MCSRIRNILIACVLIGFSMKLLGQTVIDSAILRIDNDYCTYFDTLSCKTALPAKVLMIFQDKYPTDKYHITQIFEINYNQYLLFVVRNNEIVVLDFLSSPINYFEEYHFWVYNPKSSTISSNPFVINGQFMVDQEYGFDVKLLSEPLVCVEDDGCLWIKERKHNGNSYNAVVRLKLKCDNKLALKIEQCVEEVSLCHFPNMGNNEHALIYRKQNGKDYVSTLTMGDETKAIGSFSLSKKGRAYNIKVLDDQYSKLIITSSGLQLRAIIRQYKKNISLQNEKDKK